MVERPETDSAGMLDHARQVLDGMHAIPKPLAPRAAALLARLALEDTVNSLCDAVGVDLRDARMRSRLITLQVLANEAVAGLAGMTWAGLSNACHHHAYELTPTVGEIQHLVAQVDTLISHVERLTGDV